jgi:DNA-binding GntR family transcriptional regulator
VPYADSAAESTDPPAAAPELGDRDVLAAELAQRLTLDIITLQLPPGTRLIEEELARRFRISRSPVREAMRLLDTTGLTLRMPRRGGVVAAMSRADLDAVYECRLALEPLASAGTARLAAPEAIRDLRRAWADMRAARNRGDHTGAFLANMRLTDTLHARCGNPVLARLLASVDKQALRYRFVCYRDVANFVATAVEENATLITAIEARDAAAAAGITQRLVTAALHLLRTLFPADGTKAGRAAWHAPCCLSHSHPGG